MRNFVRLVLTLFALLAAACGSRVDDSLGTPADEAAVTETTQAVHEASILRTHFDLYWFDIGVFDTDDDMWGRVDYDGGGFDPPNFDQGDLNSNPPGGGAQGIDSNLVLSQSIPAGQRFISIDVGMVEDDGQTEDDDIMDIDPGNDGDIDITVDLATGLVTGELSADCRGCFMASPGFPGDGSNGIIFHITVENHCEDIEIDGNGIDDDCDDLIDEPLCCCGDGETCHDQEEDPRCDDDRDGDSLLDFWETHGFDADCDAAHTIDVNLPSWGVSPDHKDVLLEMDYVGLGAQPTQALVRASKMAFRNGPIYAGNVDNPDGKPGINLWIDTGPLTDGNGIEPGPNAGSCLDQIDNDHDGAADADDDDCQYNYGVEGVGACDNLIDDDHDGQTDAVDPDCSFLNNFEADGSCGDGIDNDNDGARDSPGTNPSPDSKCLQVTAMEGAGTCRDQVDNDGDGSTDGVDSDCLVGDFLVNSPGGLPGGGQTVSHTLLPPGNRIIGDQAQFRGGLNTGFDAAKSAYFIRALRELFFHYMLVSLDLDARFGESGMFNREGAGGDERSCEDFTDNDGDGTADLFDTDCWSCLNGLDDDSDGQIDASDTNCVFFGNHQFGGVGEGHGNDIVAVVPAQVKRLTVGPNAGQPSVNRRLFGTDPLTLVHELGHNLGLGHGGHEARNCKPNYVSVMNYLSTGGVAQIGGHRHDLNRNGIAKDLGTLDFWPPRTATGRPDYTSIIVENALSETSAINNTDNDNAMSFFRRVGTTVSADTVPLRGDDIGPPGTSGSCALPDGIVDGTDWSGDCAISGGTLAVDLGGTDAQLTALLGNACESGISSVPMEAKNDWRIMDFNFRDDPDGAPGTFLHPSVVQAIERERNASELDLSATGRMRSDGRFEMSMVVENLGPYTSGDTYLSVPLPAGARLFQASAPTCQEFSGGTNHLVACSLGRAEAGDVFGVTLIFDVASAASCEFEAIVQNGLDDTGESLRSVATDCGVDLSITITAAPSPALAGGPLTYHVTVTNAGPSRAENVSVSMILPGGTTFQGATAPCTQSPTNTLACVLGGLNKGQSTSFDVSSVIASNLVFLNNGPATITAAAAVTSTTTPELNAANNVANVATQVIASADLDLVSITAVNPPTELIVGNAVNVVVQEVVNNHGLASPISGQVLQSATATPGAFAAPIALTPISADALLREQPRTLPANFTVRCDRAGTHTFTLRAEIRPASAFDVDPNPANNARSATLTVTCTPCLHATESLMLRDATTVTSTAVLGGTSFELGAQQATLNGNLFVRGNAFLRSTSRVNGNVTLFGTLTTQTPFTITGTLLQNTAVTIVPIPTKTVPVGSVDLSVPLGSVRTWTPGTYDEAFIAANGDARLSPGVYNFRRLQLDVDTDLVLDVTAGDILINARDFLAIGDRARFLKTGGGRVFVYTNATGSVTIGTNVQHRASLRAPQATLTAFPNTTFEGCVAARRITLDAHDIQQQPAGAGPP